MKDDFRLLLARDQVWITEVQADRAGLLVLRGQLGSLFIHSIAVAPTHQGHGLGSELMEFAHREARRQGYGQITLVANEHMRRNIDWYKRMGFHETKRVEHLGSDIVHMRKYQSVSDPHIPSRQPLANAALPNALTAVL